MRDGELQDGGVRFFIFTLPPVAGFFADFCVGEPEIVDDGLDIFRIVGGLRIKVWGNLKFHR
jgi:hypothetical protein